MKKMVLSTIWEFKYQIVLFTEKLENKKTEKSISRFEYCP